MKITAIDTAVLRIPTRKPIALDFPYHSLVAAHVHTDDGADLERLYGRGLWHGGPGAESATVAPFHTRHRG